MPTALPVRPAHERRLSWPQVARLVILVARVRWLDLLTGEALTRPLRGWNDYAGDMAGALGLA